VPQRSWFKIAKTYCSKNLTTNKKITIISVFFTNRAWDDGTYRIACNLMLSPLELGRWLLMTFIITRLNNLTTALLMMIWQQIPHVMNISSFYWTVRIIEQVSLPHADSEKMQLMSQVVLNAKTPNIIKPDLMIFT